jgi:hypothetical protein
MRAADNPFTVQKVQRIRYRLADQTWEELLARLAALRYRAAIVGPHGRGKTTLLEDLTPRLEALGFRIRSVMLHTGDRRLSREQRRILFENLAPHDLLFLDGAEQLSRAAWLALRWRSRAACGLVVTSHRPGLLPTLLDCTTSPELLAGIVSDLLGREMDGSEELFVRHGGNLREALREMYDVWAMKVLATVETPRGASPSEVPATPQGFWNE